MSGIELRMSGIELRRVSYRERLKIPRHRHATAGFCLVLDGTYTERYRSRTLRCDPRTVTFSPAGEEHANEFDDARCDCFTIELAPEWLARFDAGALGLDRPFFVRGGPLEWLARRLHRESRTGDEPAPIMIEGLVLEMIGTAARDARCESTRVRRSMRDARALIELRYAEALSLSDVAGAVGLHPVYVAGEFRRAYGETVGDCVRRVRVERAADALTASDESIAGIALACGFANQSHFTRVFRRAIGVTPARYRRALRS